VPGLEEPQAAADTSRVRARLRIGDEDGFGLVELLIAMVVLNIGILALVATFQAGALAINRSAATSNGTAVADKVMEVYRSMPNAAIYLKNPASGGSDSGGWPNGIPNSTSVWYSAYQGNTAAYNGGAYFSYATPTAGPWITTSTTAANFPPIPVTNTALVPSSATAIAGNAVQGVTGPDGQSYPVFTYITALTTGSSRYVKQVVVVVRDPRNTARTVARESSLFDPLAGQ
jgi:Tfp pilus assembly protein PilV